MAQLAEKVKKEAPQHQFMLQGLVRNFRPGLVINMAESASDVKAVVKRLQEATRKVLSIEADFLGTLPYHPDVRKSVRELVPIVARSPHGPVAGFFRNLVLKLAEQSGVN
jgi:MinD-like ATPase involved in chromosome partitioning or flagellar assembly